MVGSRCGPLDAAVDWLARKRVDPTDLIGARYPLDEAPGRLCPGGRSGGDESAARLLT